MDDLRKKVGTMLRAALQSSKEGVLLSGVSSDYRKMTGENIPFRELGYSNLRDMLISMSDVLRVRQNKDGLEAAFAIADESTAHIQSLISRQKTSKPKQPPQNKSRRYPNRSGTYRTRTTSANSFMTNYFKPRIPNYHNNRSSYEHHYLQRIPTPEAPIQRIPTTTQRIPTPTAAMAPASTIMPQSRSRGTNYVVPPRFQKKKEEAAFPTRSHSPILPPPASPPPSEIRRPSARAASFDYSVPGSHDPKRLHSRALTRSGSFEDSDLPLSNPPYAVASKNFSFDNSNLVNYEPAKPLSRTSAVHQTGLDALPKRTVTLIPLVAGTREPERSSSTSPVSPISPVPGRSSTAGRSKSRKKRTGKETSRQLIDEYAAFHGEQPIYRSLPIKTKKSGVAYVSTLNLLNTKYYSYPDEKPSVEEAEEIAASKAVKALNIVPGQYLTMPAQTPSKTPQQIGTLVERLHEIISKKPNGIWHTKVPNFYEEIYSESLPKNWLEILKERCLDLSINNMVDENYILSLENSHSKSPVLQEKLPSAMSARVPEPEPLVLPESNDWDVFVTNISESLGVAIRLIDYSDQYDHLVQSMDEYYSSRQHPAKEIVAGDVYAVKSEDSWYRVRVLGVSNGKAECYFLDNGDTESIDVHEVNILMPHFFALPYQAIQCKLVDLEQYVQNSAVYQKVFDLAFGKTLVATVVSRDVPLTLHLYDTSTEEDIDINEILVDVGNKYTMTPHLPDEEQVTQGFLTHVTDEGDLFIQVIGPSLNILEDLTTDIAALCEDRKGLVTKVSPTKMYCAKYTNGLWYRAYVRNCSPDDPNMVTVWYVDYGNTSVIPISDICEVDSVSEFLSVLPHQALRCRLHDVPTKKSQQWTKEATSFLQKIVSDDPDRPLIIKLVKKGTDTSLPQVNLFKRIRPTDELTFLNQTLWMEDWLFTLPQKIKQDAPAVLPPSKPSNTITPSSLAFQGIPDVALSAHMFEKSKRNLHSESTVDSNEDTLPSLLPPEIPDVGQVFDVIVSMAAQPHNFTVQPWSSSIYLDDLMTEMQSFYNSEDNVCDMHECLLKEGEFYASKHRDGQWYRSCVIKKMSDQPDTVSVYFVDFGDYYLMTLNDLQPLWKRFRSLPFQAIRASLADVVPLEGDWDPMDCVHFQKMVVDKQFVSTVKSKTVDKSNNLGGYELGLTLIDTSTDKDINVNDLLVEKGNAKLL